MARGLIVAGLLFVVACSKKDEAPKPADKPAEPASPAPTDKPADPPADKPADAPAAKLKAGPASSDLAKLPVASDVVAGIDLGQLATSALWNELIAPQVLTESVKGKLAELKQKCDLDPLAAVKTATVGYQTASREVVIIVHGPEKAKVVACADKLKADGDAKLEVATDGEATILKPKGGGGPAVAFTFIGDRDAIVAVGSNANGAGLKAIASSTGGLATLAGFVDAYNKASTDEALWLVANGKIDQLKGLATLGLKTNLVFGSLDVRDGMDLDLRLRLASQDQATQMATMAKSQMDGAKSMLKLDKAEVSADGTDLKLNFVAAKQNLQEMVKGATGMVKMMGGGR